MPKTFFLIFVGVFCYGHPLASAQVVIANGSFEAGLAGWNCNAGIRLLTNALEGNRCAGFGVAGEICQTFAVHPGATYGLQYDVATDGGNSYKANIGVELKAGDTRLSLGGSSVRIPGPGAYQNHVRYYQYFVVPQGATNVTLRFCNRSSASAVGIAVIDSVGLRLITLVTIVAQPQEQLVNQGATAIFSVRAVGAGAMTYQWRFNDAALPGATGATLTVANARRASAGNYSVRVGDGFGSAQSQEARLTVVEPSKGVFEAGVAGLRGLLGRSDGF